MNLSCWTLVIRGNWLDWWYIRTDRRFTNVHLLSGFWTREFRGSVDRSQSHTTLSVSCRPEKNPLLPHPLLPSSSQKFPNRSTSGPRPLRPPLDHCFFKEWFETEACQCNKIDSDSYPPSTSKKDLWDVSRRHSLTLSLIIVFRHGLANAISASVVVRDLRDVHASCLLGACLTFVSISTIHEISGRDAS